MGAGVRAVCAAAPSARAPASRPPGRCRLPRESVCTHAHTRAHTSVHAPPPGTCSSRTCGRTPLCCLPRPVTFSPCGAAFAWLVAWTRRDSPRARHNLLRSPTLSRDTSWDFRTPGQVVPGTSARRRAHGLQLQLRLRAQLTLISSLFASVPHAPAGRVSAPSGVYPFSRPLLRRSVTFETWNCRGN